MKFDELTTEQKLQVKQSYMVRLAEKGMLMQFLQGDDHEEERGPSWDEMADADKLIPDQLVSREDVDYVEDDFGPDGYDIRDCDKILRWAVSNINYTKFHEAHPNFHPSDVVYAAIKMALDWAKESVAQKCSELVMEVL